MNTSGFLLVIEGIDGAGKSTLQRRLSDWCRTQGRTVITSREPTDGPHGRALRESARTGRLSPEAELELFLKDRHEHVTNVIAPALARGEIVILDRYYLSTAAYQGARGINPEQILAANEAFAPPPDLVLLLDLDPSSGHDRIGSRGGAPDGFEGAAYLADVRRIFLGFDRPYIRRINASRTANEVGEECEQILKQRIEEPRGS
ncbi:MAG TPA: dTMP kinase [Chthoniobacteraceae bacterium]|nr:dTMP kinase [Chthoniobacteraceae bacterium]